MNSSHTAHLKLDAFLVLSGGLFCLILFSVFTVTCTGKVTGKSDRNKAEEVAVQKDSGKDSLHVFPYNLAEPLQKYSLPQVLDEISGICMMADHQLACVQDEEGTVFVYDLKEKMISHRIHFGKPGDYEDIAIADSLMWVLKSNGSLYKITRYVNEEPKVEFYNTALKSLNDCEGLAYDPVTGSLMIACKGSPSIQEENPYKGFRSVYRFPIGATDIDKEPVLLIELRAIKDLASLDAYEKWSYDLAGTLHPNGNITFQPSGIAIHPLSGHFFILAHVGKMILEVDRAGRIVSKGLIDPALLPQPEGICFDGAGRLYLSSEAAGEEAVILMYDLH
jgi:hypothetical protein